MSSLRRFYCNSLSSSDSVLLSSNVSTCTSTVARVPNPSLVDTVNLSEGHHNPIAGVTVPLQDGGSSSTGQSPPVSNCPFLIDPVLAFVKAFRLRGDVDSLKRSVGERFSSELVEGAKRSLWDSCCSFLEGASFPFMYAGILEDEVNSQPIWMIYWKLSKPWIILIQSQQYFVKPLTFHGCHHSPLILWEKKSRQTH